LRGPARRVTHGAMHRRRGERDWRRRAYALSDRRLLLGYSQEELAEVLHTTRQTISAIETGRSKPNVLPALALARALDTTVEELFA
jgi:DNA-binding XRE family transcriptional regulator